MLKIIIDTDIGDDIDDAYALSLALNTKELNILGITTVYRNCHQRALITKSLLNDFGRTDIEVYAGEDFPVKEPIFFWSYDTVNPDGRPNLAHYKPEMSRFKYSDKHAVEFYREAVNQYPYEITLVCLGPLTNLGLFAEKYPEDYKKLHSILLMGGCFGTGGAEWNIKCDPESAQKALNCQVPVKMVTFDVTKETYLLKDHLDALEACQKQYIKTLMEITKLWVAQRNFKKPPIMHDALAISELTQKFCDYKRERIRIETQGRDRGMTIADADNYTFVADVALAVRREDFIKYFIQKMAGEDHVQKNTSDNIVVGSGGADNVL
ncbi:MAG TPA: nucleoside hydrolase [Clostridia bacterium]|jgi:purine nucleosidase